MRMRKTAAALVVTAALAGAFVPTMAQAATDGGWVGVQGVRSGAQPQTQWPGAQLTRSQGAVIDGGWVGLQGVHTVTA